MRLFLNGPDLGRSICMLDDYYYDEHGEIQFRNPDASTEAINFVVAFFVFGVGAVALSLFVAGISILIFGVREDDFANLWRL